MNSSDTTGFLRNKRILFLSGLPWHYVFQPYRSLYARRLAVANRVTWFNPPQVNPVRFLMSNFRHGGVRDGVRIYTPYCSKRQYGSLSRIDVALLSMQGRWLAGLRNDSNQLIWSVYYGSSQIAAAFPRAFRIYWPGDTFDPAEELEQLRHYDLVMPLTEEKAAAVAARYPNKTMLSTTGCDFDAFRAAEIGTREAVEARLKGLRRPIVGYAGHISCYRIDFELLEHLCRAMPEVSFVFAGAQDGQAATTEAVSNLSGSCPNACFIGEFRYADLPYLIKHFDVGIIPYRLNEFNLGTNPNKLYEYFTLGKPVVSTMLPSLRKFERHVALANDKDGFVSSVASCLIRRDVDGAKETRMAIARECSPAESLERLDAFILGRMAGSARA